MKKQVAALTEPLQRNAAHGACSCGRQPDGEWDQRPVAQRHRALIGELSAAPSPLRSGGIIQRYSRENAGDLPYQGLTGGAYKLADARDVLLPEGGHYLYATDARIKEAGQLLTQSRAGVQIEAGAGLAPEPQAVQPAEPMKEVRVIPNQGEKNTPFLKATRSDESPQHEQEEACLKFPNSCRMAARTAMSGNPMDTSYALFNDPGGNGQSRTSSHLADESDKEWAMHFPRQIRQAWSKKLMELAQPTEIQEAQKTAREKMRQVGPVDRGLAEVREEPTRPTEEAAFFGELYRALDPGRREVFDRFAGINRFALPDVGQGYTAGFDFDLTSAGTQKGLVEGRADTEETIRREQAEGIAQGMRPTHHQTKGHWAMVVMKSARDRVTVESQRNTGKYSSLTPGHRWSLEMYGAEKDTFHDKWDMTKGKYTTLAVKSERGTGPVVTPTDAPRIVQGDPAQADAQVIQQVRHILTHWRPADPMMPVLGSPSRGSLLALIDQFTRHEVAYVRQAAFQHWMAVNNVPIDAVRIMDDV